ncbi:MAG: hypothetical protein GY862_38830 [Gammaproteobacteria bacterium]|nr:hypothetical protein [Gammaproteobacteria bacterium]
MSKRSIDFGRFGNAFAFILLLAAGMFLNSAAAVSGSGPHFDTAELRQFTSGGHMLGFGADYFYLAGRDHGLKIEFVGAGPAGPQSAADGAAGGSEAKAAPLDEVNYPNLWDGIDLSYRAAPGGIAESVYRLAPGADAAQVRLRYNRPVSLTANGGLSLAYGSGSLRESPPEAWQYDDKGRRVPVAAAFVLHDEQTVGFRLDLHDRNKTLWIDPVLTWNTFVDGSADDKGTGIAVDAGGSIYITGRSNATWGAPARVHYGSSSYDVFVAKLDSSGNLLWNTFLGGSGLEDTGGALAVDAGGNIYVTGNSDATWGAPVRAHTSGMDAFVAKLDGSNGNLLWHTFLGGSGLDNGNGIAIDAGGNVYITGQSSATWGSTPVRAYTATGEDAFVAKLDNSGNLSWNTFLGGGGSNERGYSIALDAGGNIYITGESSGTWGAPVRAYTSSPDVLVAKLDNNGNLSWNTFLGGSSNDYGKGIALDAGGNIYITGYSLTTWGTPLRAYTNFDTIVAKLNNSGIL